MAQGERYGRELHAGGAIVNAKAELRRKVAAHNMDPSRNLLPPTQTTKRYLICSSERSGSTLLTDLLDQTKLAGRPLEYFNPVYIEAYCRNNKVTEMLRHNYWLDLQKMRTTQNGIFGAKAHLPQILQWLGEDNIQAIGSFLAGFDHLLFIKRRDKLGQAISFYRAVITGHWSSQHSKLDTNPVETPRFDALRIASALEHVLAAELNWRRVFAQLQMNPIEIDYENLVSNPNEIINRILAGMGVSGRQIESPKSNIRRQRDTLNDELRQRFLSYISPT